MRDRLLKIVKNEEGAVLWIVLLFCFISLLVISTIIHTFIQQHQILDMRLGQLQATEMVKNGVVYLKEMTKNDLHPPATLMKEYANGHYIIILENQNNMELTAMINGYSSKGYVQSYRVKFDLKNHRLTHYTKIVGS